MPFILISYNNLATYSVSSCKFSNFTISPLYGLVSPLTTNRKLETSSVNPNPDLDTLNPHVNLLDCSNTGATPGSFATIIIILASLLGLPS